MLSIESLSTTTRMLVLFPFYKILFNLKVNLNTFYLIFVVGKGSPYTITLPLLRGLE